MEGTFWRTKSAERGRRRKSQWLYQIVAAAVIAALLAVALWVVLRDDGGSARPDNGSMLANQSGGQENPSPGKTTAPKSSSKDAAKPPGDLTAAELAAEGHVPPAPPPAEQVTAERKKELAGKFAEAETALTAGKDLLVARKLFNEVVDQGLAAEANERCLRRLAELANKTLFGPVRVAGDSLTSLFKVPPRGTLDRIGKRYKVQAALLQRINGITNPRRLQANQTIKVVHGPFNALVDKSDYILSLYLDVPGEEGKGPTPVLIRRYRVGLGEHSSTPTGVWRVKKMELNRPWRNPRTNELVPVGDPKYPLGKPGRWIGLEGVGGKAVGQLGYGIHGTQDRDSIGKEASLGCVRMFDEGIAELWGLLRIGDSRVTIRD